MESEIQFSSSSKHRGEDEAEACSPLEPEVSKLHNIFSDGRSTYGYVPSAVLAVLVARFSDMTITGKVEKWLI